MAAASTVSVDEFLAALDHPRKAEILEVREIILAADPAIGEAVKWNAPSFRTTEFFATFHLRARDGVQVILHRGARRRADAPGTIDDPAALLEWLGADRASVKFRDLADVREKLDAFTALIRAWLVHV